ncbi:hypothetical protein HK098_002644 [Nowakowskiella sp. JEL0407]|nr:hypothetical protein HK098_002644 [Nowakowskiella sp. JEL0407]
MDWIPVVSQVKSAVQALSGDTEGAKQTQENFIKRCPIISQCNSAVHLALGDTKTATEVQQSFLTEFLDPAVSSLPVLGHLKGGVHYALGEKEKGDECMKTATRTTAVMGVGVMTGGAGFAAAAAAGIAAGVAVDGITTGIESKLKDTYTPSGTISIIQNASTAMEKQPEKTSGFVFDAVCLVALDAISAAGAASTRASATKLANGVVNPAKTAVVAGRTAVVGVADGVGMKSSSSLDYNEWREGQCAACFDNTLVKLTKCCDQPRCEVCLLWCLCEK